MKHYAQFLTMGKLCQMGFLMQKVPRMPRIALGCLGWQAASPTVPPEPTPHEGEPTSDFRFIDKPQGRRSMSLGNRDLGVQRRGGRVCERRR